MPPNDQDKIPVIKVPLDAFVREIAVESARVAAQAIIMDHARTCPVTEVKATAERNRADIVETKVKFAWMVGAMVGSGVLGGTVTTILGRLL